MKVGDKVRVIKLMIVDEEHTNLKIGDIGIIKYVSENNVGTYTDTCSVNFGENFTCKDRSRDFDTIDGTYDMFLDQLELVEDET